MEGYTKAEHAAALDRLAADIQAGYSWRYEQDDCGTERLLTVYRPDGSVAGQVDPFWNRRMPVQAAARTAALRRRAAALVAADRVVAAA